MLFRSPVTKCLHCGAFPFARCQYTEHGAQCRLITGHIEAHAFMAGTAEPAAAPPVNYTEYGPVTPQPRCQSIRLLREGRVQCVREAGHAGQHANHLYSWIEYAAYRTAEPASESAEPASEPAMTLGEQGSLRHPDRRVVDRRVGEETVERGAERRHLDRRAVEVSFQHLTAGINAVLLKRKEDELRALAAQGPTQEADPLPERKLRTFLYVLLRDHVPSGVIEHIFDTHTAIFRDGATPQLSNRYMAQYASDLVRRLR